MAQNKDINLIEKLNDSNYANWHFKMKMILIKEDLYKYVTDDPPEPITAEWTNKDNKARAIINLSIDDSQIINVINLNSTKQTWLALKSLHQRNNLSNKLYLLRKLYAIRMSENDDMVKHINSVLSIVEECKNIGEIINDDHVIAILLNSLPPNYETLVTSLEGREIESLTLTYVKSKLLDHYRRICENSQNSVKSNTVYKSVNRKAQNYRNGNKFCTNCGYNNTHISNNCFFLIRKNFQKNPNNKNNNNKSSKELSKSLCFIATEDEYKTETSGLDKTIRSASNENTEQKVSDRVQTSYSLKEKVQNSCTTVKEENRYTNFIIDSAANQHIVNNKKYFNYLDYGYFSEIQVANGQVLNARAKGNICLDYLNDKNEIIKIEIKDVLLCEDLNANLLSVRKIIQHDYNVLFTKNECLFIKNDEVLLRGKLEESLLYEINFLNAVKTFNVKTVNKYCKNKNCILKLHERLGHRNFADIQKLINNKLAYGIDIAKCEHELNCDTCNQTKLTQAPYPKHSSTKTTHVLDLIHTDICVMNTPSVGGKRYFVVFVDDFSRYTVTYLLTHKSEMFSKLKEFVAHTRNTFNKTIKAIRSDNAAENVSLEFENYLKEHGIERQLTVPYAHSQNGLAERKIRYLVDITRTLLKDANLGKQYWGEALNTATYLSNRLPTHAHNKTPYELWRNKKPNLANIKRFGCKAYAFIEKHKRDKLDDRGILGTFVGYDYRSKGYRILVDNNKIMISRTVKFVESEINNVINSQDDTDISVIDTNEFNINSSDNLNVSNNEDQNTTISEASSNSEQNSSQSLRRSKRENRGVPPERFGAIANMCKQIEPKTFNEILNMENKSEKQNWINATNEEIKSLEKNKTWTLVPKIPGKRIIGSKWTFKIKRNSNGEIERYKARLVAQGFSQKYGSDYYETYAPVVSYSTVRTFLSVAIYKNLQINHLDIKTAFLHGDLDEDVLMYQPEGYIKEGQENYVCKLNRAIYGLKQAARAWHTKIAESLNKLGFIKCDSDPCLFKKGEENNIMYVIIYVDDFLVAGNDKNIKDMVDKLSVEFEIKNLGYVKQFLGININQLDDGSLVLDQTDKIDQLIKKFNLTNSKPTYIPMNTDYHKQTNDEKYLENNDNYRQAIGSLLYIATITRPDISLCVNMLGRKIEKPTEADWAAVEKVIKYLKTTKHLKFMIDNHQPPILTAYSDADWGGDKSDRKSTTGNVVMLGNNVLHWNARKQTCVALSSTEAEFVSLANVTKEIKWFIRLLQELDIKQSLPIIVKEDNISCIKLCENEKLQSKMKHIDIKHCFIKDLIDKGVIQLQYCESPAMIADGLTKPKPRPAFEHFRNNMQIKTSPSGAKKGC